MDQQSLLDWTPPNHRYRNGDPVTCAVAAERSAMRASEGRMLVLKHLCDGPLTDFGLAAATGWQQTSIGKRRLEAQRAGLVDRYRDGKGNDITRPSPSGSPALVWCITPKGRAFYAEHRGEA